MIPAALESMIQRKLSELLGREVTFEKLTASLLSGSIECQGVRVAGNAGDDPPFLTIQRIRADVAVGRALKGEIASVRWRSRSPCLTSSGTPTGRPTFPDLTAARRATRTMIRNGGRSTWKNS